MTYEWRGETDIGLGLAIVMMIIAAVGALLMIVGALEQTAAWGFAIVVFAGIVAIWAIHAYPQ